MASPLRKNNALMTKLRQKQGRKCCYCYRPISRHAKNGKPQKETVEHLRRRADGGTNHHDNIALACLECNSTRGDVDWLTWKSIKMGEIQP